MLQCSLLEYDEALVASSENHVCEGSSDTDRFQSRSAVVYLGSLTNRRAASAVRWPGQLEVGECQPGSEVA